MYNSEKQIWNDETIGRIFGIIYEVLYSMALYKEIRPRERENKIFDPYLRQFWISISNNAILMAIINWCKVFGAGGRNYTHYTHFIDSEHFKSKLDEELFLQISESMKNVRDKFGAHEDRIKERVKIPDFEKAMKVMEAFRESVQEEYDCPEIPSIQGQYNAYRLQIRNCLKDCKIDWELYDEDE